MQNLSYCLPLVLELIADRSQNFAKNVREKTKMEHKTVKYSMHKCKKKKTFKDEGGGGGDFLEEAKGLYPIKSILNYISIFRKVLDKRN